MSRIFICMLLLKVILAQKNDDGAALDVIMQINNNALSKFSVGQESNTMPQLFEGDIVRTKSLDNDIANMEYAALKGITKFDAITNGAWSQKTIPYTFHSRFNTKGRAVVRQAVADYHKNTCIKWVPRTTQRSYVIFFHGGGCYSMIGQQGGPQRISLANPGCLQKGVTIHEMMHCAGFYHEQSRTDRDRYIRINWRNIPTSVQYNFKKYRTGQASTLGASYDKKSVMHYGNYAFSNNGRKTIVSLRDANEKLGQRVGFSTIDVKQLNAYYKCKTGGTTKPKPKPTTGNCKDSFIFCNALKSYCSQHSWVGKNCLKTCNKCAKPPVASCKDKNQYCPSWAKRGYCKSRNQGYKQYMMGNCKKSCRQC